MSIQQLRALHRNIIQTIIRIRLEDEQCGLSVDDLLAIASVVQEKIDSLIEPTGNHASPHGTYRPVGKTRDSDVAKSPLPTSNWSDPPTPKSALAIFGRTK